MTFSTHLLAQFTLPQILEFILRIIVACLCGACIGFERTKRFKEAGIRTHIIVCCAAALIMLISKYGFADLTMPDGSFFPGVRGADSARVAAQCISGISFLGAGVIFKNGNAVKGLTTAAGIWATAAIGLAIGAGMYIMGLFVTLIVTLLQVVMHRFTIGADAFNASEMQFVVRDSAQANALITQQLHAWRATIHESKVSRVGPDQLKYRLTVRCPKAINHDDFNAFVQANPDILSGENRPIG